MYALSALVLALIGLITAVSLCVQATFIPILYDVKNGRPLILKKDSIANATHHHYQFLVNDILYGPSLRLWNKVMLTNETSTSTPYFSSADYAKLVNARNHSILPSTPLGFATITARYWKDMGDIDNFLAVPRLAEMVYRLLKAGSNSSRSDHKYFTNEIKDMRQRLRSHPLRKYNSFLAFCIYLIV